MSSISDGTWCELLKNLADNRNAWKLMQKMKVRDT